MELVPALLEAIEQAAGYADGYLMIVDRAVETLWLTQHVKGAEVIERNLREKILAPDYRYPMTDARLSLARLSALQARHEEATAWFAEARRVLDEQGARPLRAITDYDEALMYHRRAGSGDVERAQPLLEAALTAFRDIGMRGWIRRAECLLHTGREWTPGTESQLQTASATAAAASAALPSGLFVKEGDSWRIAYAGKESRLADSRGLGFLAQLLSRPGREIASVDLVADPHGEDPAAFGDNGEQARVNVRRAVVLALRKIAARHPVLGEHLTRTVRTGTSCVYAPDPLAPVDWKTS